MPSPVDKLHIADLDRGLDVLQRRSGKLRVDMTPVCSSRLLPVHRMADRLEQATCTHCRRVLGKWYAEELAAEERGETWYPWKRRKPGDPLPHHPWGMDRK